MVRFPSDNACEIVQKTWIKKCNSGKFKTNWPTDYAGRDINVIVKNDESINDTAYCWRSYSCTILYECGKFVISFINYILISKSKKIQKCL